MAQWGKADFEQLKQLQKRLEQLEKTDFDIICRSIAQELAARLLAMAKNETPVKTGHLRRQWTVQSVEKQGNGYVATVFNGVDYASYVEYGHRTANHKGWVRGQFMMTKAERNLMARAPGLAEKKLQKYLQEALNGK